MPSSGGQTCADRKSTRLNSSHTIISYAVFCLKKKTTTNATHALAHPTPHALPRSAAPPARGGCAGRVGVAGARRCVGRWRVQFFFFFKAGAPPRVHPFSPPARPPI